MSIGRQIELLWRCANTLQNEQHVQKLLKSYYINTCRKLDQNCLRIPEEKCSMSQMCPYCGTFWNNSEYDLKLIPKQIKITSKAIKLVKTFERNDGDTGTGLSKKQRNRAKWLKKKISNRLSIKCSVCKRISFSTLGNRKGKQSVKNEKKVQSSCKIVSEISKKCNDHIKNMPDSKGNQKAKILPGNKTHVETNSVDISLHRNKTKRNKICTKVISETQKKNSLLQLAALLRKESNGNSKNSTQKRLQSLLK